MFKFHICSKKKHVKQTQSIYNVTIHLIQSLSFPFLSNLLSLLLSCLQSRYFDCDDDESDDTFSNLSALIDSDDFLTHVDNEGFYCNGNDENCNYGYDNVEATCNTNIDNNVVSDVDVSVVVKE